MRIYITSSDDFYKDQIIYNLFEVGLTETDTIILSSKKKNWYQDLEDMAQRYRLRVEYHKQPDSFCDKILYLNNDGYHEVITLEF